MNQNNNSLGYRCKRPIAAVLVPFCLRVLLTQLWRWESSLFSQVHAAEWMLVFTAIQGLFVIVTESP